MSHSSSQRNYLVQLAKETCGYFDNIIKRYSTKELPRTSTSYLWEELEPIEQKSREKKETVITVKDQDTFAAAQELIREEQYERVCVLNLASEHHPGGGWFSGALAKKSNCFDTAPIH